MRFLLSISTFESKAIRFLRFKDAFNRKAIRIIANGTRGVIISNEIPRFFSVNISGDNNVSLEQASCIEDIGKILGFARRIDISKMWRNKLTIRVVIIESEKRFRAKTEETAEYLEYGIEYQH